MPEFTRYKKRISYRFSHRFSHREKKSCVFSAAGSLTSSSSVPRRPPPPDGASGLHHPYCTPPTSTFFPLLTFFSFLLYIPFFNSFSFFCISLSVHLSFLFLFMRIFMCTYRLAFGTQLHQLPLTLFPCVCLLVHSFFPYFALYMLGCILFCSWIPLRAHSLFCFFLAFFVCIPLRIYLISQSVYACRTLCIFFVYIFMCVFYC